MEKIYNFNLWSAPSFIFWSLVFDATAWGPAVFGVEGGGACRILDSTSNSLT